jgi:hypothetical protein
MPSLEMEQSFDGIIVSQIVEPFDTRKDFADFGVPTNAWPFNPIVATPNLSYKKQQ